MTGTPQPVRTWLQPDERVLWQGRPIVRSYVLRGAWYVIPFSVLWAGFAFFWEFMVVTGGAPSFFAIWGIPFVLIGLYMLVGRWWVAAREAANSAYAITDRRVLILSGAFRRNFAALELRNMPGAHVDYGSNGTGSITFGSVSGFRMPPGWPTFVGGWRYPNPPTFWAISDVANVFAIYQKAVSEAR